MIYTTSIIDGIFQYFISTEQIQTKNTYKNTKQNPKITQKSNKQTKQNKQNNNKTKN